MTQAFHHSFRGVKAQATQLMGTTQSKYPTPLAQSYLDQFQTVEQSLDESIGTLLLTVRVDDLDQIVKRCETVLFECPDNEQCLRLTGITVKGQAITLELAEYVHGADQYTYTLDELTHFDKLKLLSVIETVL